MSTAFEKQLGGGQHDLMSNISDLGFVCVEYIFDREVLSHLQFGLNNLRVIDLTMLCNSCLSLTLVGINLLLERCEC